MTNILYFANVALIARAIKHAIDWPSTTPPRFPLATLLSPSLKASSLTPLYPIDAPDTEQPRTFTLLIRIHAKRGVDGIVVSRVTLFDLAYAFTLLMSSSA